MLWPKFKGCFTVFLNLVSRKTSILFTFQSQLLAFHPLYCTSVSISLISFFFITVEPHYLWITYLRMSTLEYLSVTLNSILVMLLTVILKHVHRAARN